MLTGSTDDFAMERLTHMVMAISGCVHGGALEHGGIQHPKRACEQPCVA